MVLLIRFGLMFLVGDIGVQVVAGGNITAPPAGADESWPEWEDELEEEEEEEVQPNGTKHAAQSSPERRTNILSSGGCCRRRRDCGDRRRQQQECSAANPPPTAPVTNNIYQSNTCGDNSECTQTNQVHIVNCNMAQQKQCKINGRTVRAASNAACDQAIASFWSDNVQSQTCVSPASRVRGNIYLLVASGMAIVLRAFG